ncbi:hypothetical protein ACIGW4_14750 [Streptomyces sp. NPDC053513]|uniref:hypothetical protein n=1 Tax=unclassified Streptomyces TaxID=2593676 RepID=UPI0037CD9F16
MEPSSSSAYTFRPWLFRQGLTSVPKERETPMTAMGMTPDQEREPATYFRSCAGVTLHAALAAHDAVRRGEPGAGPSRRQG